MGELQFLEKMLGNIIRPIIRESVEEVIPKYFEKKVQRRYSIKEFCEKFGIAESSFHNWANANGIERIKDGHNTYVDADIVDEKAARGDIGKYVHQKRKKRKTL